MDFQSNQQLYNKHDKQKHIKEKRSPVISFVTRVLPSCSTITCDITGLVSLEFERYDSRVVE